MPLLFFVGDLVSQRSIPGEYVVYSVVLEKFDETHFWNHSKAGPNVFYDHTIYNAEEARSFENDYHFLTKHFIKLNENQIPLRKIWPLDNSLLISPNELATLMDEGKRISNELLQKNKGNKFQSFPSCGQNYLPFFDKYPATNGLYHLSRAAFSNNRKIVMVQIFFESDCSQFFHTQILRKIRGKWVIREQTTFTSVA